MPVHLVVTVGTDHHPFPRLIEWVDRWVERHPTPLSYTVQHGASIPSRVGESISLLPRDEFLELLASADLVVTQGGPGSILDTRSCGLLPIAVPREAARAEAVDDHQVAFTELMRHEGQAWRATTEAELHTRLDRLAADPALARTTPYRAPIADTARMVLRALEAIQARPAGFVSVPRVRDLVLPEASAPSTPASTPGPVA